MDAPRNAAAANLADNIKQLRAARGMTQQQMARLAELPRATWAHLESGAGNPTLAVLQSVARTLQVSIEELLASPRVSARHFTREEMPLRTTRERVTVRNFLPDKIPGTELQRMELPPRARMTGVPHTPGTREYLTCERGTIRLAVSGDIFLLAPGDVVVFRGDQRHSYENPADAVAVGYSVVLLAPRA